MVRVMVSRVRVRLKVRITVIRANLEIPKSKINSPKSIAY